MNHEVKDQLKTYQSAAPVPLFHLSDQLICGELSPHHQDEALDDVLGTVHVQQTTDHDGQTAGVHLECNVNEEASSNLSPLWATGRLQCVSHLLDINLNVLLQVVAVQVEDQVVDKVKTVADDDERQLVSKFGFLSITHIGEKNSV